MSKNNTHICFISPWIYSYLRPGSKESGGGAERQQYLIGQKLFERGYQVSYITNSEKETTKETIEGFNVWTDLPKSGGLRRAPYRVLKLVKLLNQIDADIYYIRGNPFLLVATALACKVHARPYVYAVANDTNVDLECLNQKNPILKSAYIRSMRNATAITVLRKSQKKKIKNNFGLKSEVIPCGYTLPDESEVIAHDDRKYILWVGTIDKNQKRPDMFIDLAKELPDIEFTMIGPKGSDPEYNNYIEKEAKQLENMEFVGFVSPDQIHEYYNNAIALVTTSAYEGFGNVLLEAWRYATPVISLKYDLDGELKSQSIGIHSGSMDQLRDDVQKVCDDPSLRSELGQNGREYVLESYSLEGVVDKYEHVFTSVAKEGHNN